MKCTLQICHWHYSFLCKKSSSTIVCSKRDVWWLISALNAVHLALFPANSVHYCSSESQTSTLRLSARVNLAGGIQTDRQATIHVHAHIKVHSFCLPPTPWHLHTIFLPFLLLSLFFTPLIRTQNLPSSEFQSFSQRLCVAVGSSMVVLVYPAQIGYQINILSSTGQLVQARQTASDNLSLWFDISQQRKKCLFEFKTSLLNGN